MIKVSMKLKNNKTKLAIHLTHSQFSKLTHLVMKINSTEYFIEYHMIIKIQGNSPRLVLSNGCTMLTIKYLSLGKYFLSSLVYPDNAVLDYVNHITLHFCCYLK